MFQCLAAGSSIMNREAESTAMRPLAKAVTRSLDTVRNLLREACYRNNQPNSPIKLDTNELVTELLLESLKIFDRLFAEFELCYVSAMVPVKTTLEYELQELIGVLFSETLQRALKMKLVKQEMVDECDPALMFTIPRLAIVSGLLVFPNGPLCIDKPVEQMSELFRPFRTLLHKIRELLWTLNKRELYLLEKLLCDNEQISDVKSVSDLNINSELDGYINRFYSDFALCKDYISNFYTNNDHQEIEVVEEATEASNPTTNNIDIPSTSGYFITNTISHEAMQPNICPESATRVDSLPDHDSLEVISAAAATLSSLLSENETTTTTTTNNEIPKKTDDPESTDDSGICSLDRSPSSDYCVVKGQEKLKKVTPKKCLPRKRSRFQQKKLQQQNCDSSRSPPDEDTSSVGSSDTSSFNSNCADDEEIALAMQAAEFATRKEIRAKYG